MSLCLTKRNRPAGKNEDIPTTDTNTKPGGRSVAVSSTTADTIYTGNWVERNKPVTLPDVPVHHSKVKAVRDWLSGAFDCLDRASEAGAVYIPPFVLALCGNSGCGKSTTVELICQEQGYSVLSWGSEMWESDAVSRFCGSSGQGQGQGSIGQGYTMTSNGSSGNGIFFSGGSDQMSELFKLDGVSRGTWMRKGEALEIFAMQSRYPALTVTAATANKGGTARIDGEKTRPSAPYPRKPSTGPALFPLEMSRLRGGSTLRTSETEHAITDSASTCAEDGVATGPQSARAGGGGRRGAVAKNRVRRTTSANSAVSRDTQTSLDTGIDRAAIRRDSGAGGGVDDIEDALSSDEEPLTNLNQGIRKGKGSNDYHDGGSTRETSCGGDGNSESGFIEARPCSTVNNISTASSFRISSSSSSSSKNARKVIIIHDPPILDGGTGLGLGGARTSTGEELFEFICSMNCPVVMIVSDVSGRDDFHYAVEKCLPRAIKRRVQFESIYFPPITELKMKKLLEKILKSEAHGGHRSATSAGASRKSKVAQQRRLPLPPAGECSAIAEEVAVRSAGDIRHAITQLQLLASTGGSQWARTARHISQHTQFSRGQLERQNSEPKTSSNRSFSSSTVPDAGPFPPPLKSPPGCVTIDLTLSDSEEDPALVPRAIAPVLLPSAFSTTSSSASSLPLPPPPGERGQEQEQELEEAAQKKRRRRKRKVVADTDSDSGTDIIASSESAPAPIPVLAPARVPPMPQASLVQLESASSSSGRSELLIPLPMPQNERDSSFSSLHSVAKIMSAKLDAFGQLAFCPDDVVNRSDMSAELILLFFQWNIIANLNAAPRVRLPAREDLAPAPASAPGPASIEHGSTAEDGNGLELPCVDMDEVAAANQMDLSRLHETLTVLDICSEIDVYIGRKYDPAIFMERSGSSSGSSGGSSGSFPDGYTTALLSRGGAVARGVGALEHSIAAKELLGESSRGSRREGIGGHAFVGVRRPKVLDLRTSALQLRDKLDVLQEEIAKCTISSRPTSSLYFPAETGYSLGPHLGVEWPVGSRGAPTSTSTTAGAKAASSNLLQGLYSRAGRPELPSPAPATTLPPPASFAHQPAGPPRRNYRSLPSSGSMLQPRPTVNATNPTAMSDQHHHQHYHQRYHQGQGQSQVPVQSFSHPHELESLLSVQVPSRRELVLYVLPFRHLVLQARRQVHALMPHPQQHVSLQHSQQSLDQQRCNHQQQQQHAHPQSYQQQQRYNQPRHSQQKHQLSPFIYSVTADRLLDGITDHPTINTANPQGPTSTQPLSFSIGNIPTHPCEYMGGWDDGGGSSTAGEVAVDSSTSVLEEDDITD